MDFRRADFGLFRMLVERVPWEKVLKGKAVQAGCTFFKEEVCDSLILGFDDHYRII